MAVLEGQASEALVSFRQQRLTEGVVRLGALLRVPADLSDPVLTGGPEGYPAGVTREYYAFVAGSLDKIPVVLDDRARAQAASSRLCPQYWNGLLGRSRIHSDVIRTELFRSGRLVDHRTIDYRSPVFGVASLSYSRAVTAIAATWLAVWREARGDLTRTPRPRRSIPRDAPPIPGTPASRPRPPTGSSHDTARDPLRLSQGGNRRARHAGWSSAGSRSSPPAAPPRSCPEEGARSRSVSDVTGFPEILDGRVKTLHPKVHGGILARRDVPGHERPLKEQGITPIDVVVVNLYPFEDKVAKGVPFARPWRTSTSAGRPCCGRRPRTSPTWPWSSIPPTTRCCSSSSTARTASTRATRLYLAQKAFRHTARYEAAIAGYFAQVEAKAAATRWRRRKSVFPYRLALSYEKVQDLRYGENPHQRAAFYSDLGSTLYSVAAARKVQGKELSFNNILDLDAAWRLVTEIHGAGLRDREAHEPLRHRRSAPVRAEAYERAWDGDPMSAFGGILAFNRRVDAATARAPRRDVRGGGDRARLRRRSRRRRWRRRRTSA